MRKKGGILFFCSKTMVPGRFSTHTANCFLRPFPSMKSEKGHLQQLVKYIGRLRESKKSHKFPQHVSHYWPNYDPELANRDPKPRTLVQYVFAGMAKAESTGESYFLVEKIAEGLLRLGGNGGRRKNFSTPQGPPQRRPRIRRNTQTFGSSTTN